MRPLFCVWIYKGEEMKQLFSRTGLFTGALLVEALPAMANVSEGPPDYSGITGLYYVLIAIVLIYGVYDTFFKKS
jgi:hypothetical protein